jgi:propionyl-CoA carboxylase alpha chain
MGEQAAALAKLVGYKTAGTCEFLVDSKRNFYFLEMNTRLQVEHPITEYTTGLDLVELMIRIAAGEPLPLKQSDVKLQGWAFESRVYAEDPYRNFLPSIGILERYREPMVGDPNVRCDSGVREGDEISIYYDPLICKLVTYGANREAAIERMRHALDSYVIRGVNHNVCFLRSVLENPRFLKGDISTNFIPQEFPKGFQGFVVDPRASDELIGAACVMEYTRIARDNSVNGQLRGYRAPTELHRTVRVEETDFPVKIERNAAGNGYLVHILNEDRSIEVVTNSHISSDVIELQIDSKHATLQLMAELGDGYRIQRFGTQYPIRVLTTREAELFPVMPIKKKIDESRALLSPMPGRIHSVAVKVGERVSRGQEILIVEAMKMQNILRAPDNVLVKSIKVQVGQDVSLDELLVEFEPLKL